MLYIIRHGQTEQNRAKLLQGRSNLPLNASGVEQARAAGAKLAARGIFFDAVYSSPLLRAVQTAELICPRLRPVRTDARLIEMDYGPYEGMDLRAPAPELLAFFQDFVNVPAPEGMEPLGSVVARLGGFLEEHRREFESVNVLVSTHAIAMKGALEYLTPESRGGYWAKHIANCAIYTAEYKNGSFSIPKELELD